MDINDVRMSQLVEYAEKKQFIYDQFIYDQLLGILSIFTLIYTEKLSQREGGGTGI